MALDPIYPYGLHTAQTWPQIGAYFDIVKRFEIKLFVEIGVHIGGLAALISNVTRYDQDFVYLGVEHDRLIVDSWLREYILKVQERSVILYADAHDPETIVRVRGVRMSIGGTAFVLCDNGNKPQELQEYAPILSSGDYIAAHDYGTEVQDSDYDFMRDEFVEVEPEIFRAVALPLWRKL